MSDSTISTIAICSAWHPVRSGSPSGDNGLGPVVVPTLAVHGTADPIVPLGPNLTMKQAGETLTGRVGMLELLPLSAGEIRDRHETFVDRVFNGDLLDHPCEMIDRRGYADTIAAGGFPELVLGPPELRPS